MEIALYVRNPGEMTPDRKTARLMESLPKRWQGDKPCRPHRFYYGNEFCQRLIPNADETGNFFDAVSAVDAKLTLLTPPVTDQGLEEWLEVIGLFVERIDGVEVVFNDLGLFDAALSRWPVITPVLGRLLTRQKRGPRGILLKGKAPESMTEHFRHFSADSPASSGFFRGLGFVRYELDNVPGGICRDTETPASLYFPYLYVTTTRLCLTAGCFDRHGSFRAMVPCARECRRVEFELSHRCIPGQVILSGNTQFIENRELPADPDSIFIDRLVIEPRVPV